MILINGRFLSRPISGVERYATEILKCIDSVLGSSSAIEQKWKILAPQDVVRPPWVNNIDFVNCGKLSGHAWEQFELPFYARGSVLICLCNTGPIAHNRKILCLHDAHVKLIPENYSPMFRFIYSTVIPFSAVTAARITTVSNYSKSHLHLYCRKLSDRNITVVYNGHDHFRDVVEEPFQLPEKPYVAVVGSNSINKNVKIIQQIAGRLEKAGISVAVTGGHDDNVFGRPNHASAQGVLVRRMGRLSDGQLKYFLRNAFCLAFPSIYEGFGIPAVEAMSVGCPVVLSDSSCGPEICGTAALYADPYDEDAWFDAILRLKDPIIRQSLIQNGLSVITRYKWSDGAAKYIELASELAKM